MKYAIVCFRSDGRTYSEARRIGSLVMAKRVLEIRNRTCGDDTFVIHVLGVVPAWAQHEVTGIIGAS